ncbi:MAG TPA: potassium transporter Kup [Gemmatimonadaceae bacterium]|nr:potassium transporter Kup [Gemmatimonadaceae bacterium]
MAESSGPPNGPSDKDRPPAKPGDDRPATESGGTRASDASPRPLEVTGFHRTAIPQREHAPAHPTGRRLAILSLGALGIVYGDIGTSPLYALREGFNGPHAFAPTTGNVYGLLSLVTWALLLVISVKYLAFVVRADNRGEGGIMALLALVLQQERRSDDKRRRAILIMLALFGAALLTGEGIITPAISVLSAIEGLGVATPRFEHFVVPITIVILVALFSAQRFGTAKVGGLFGPVTFVWFVTIGTLGALEIAREPEILWALNPYHAIRFFVDNGKTGFFILGAVVLVITGGEALYADMGHFGKRPIRVAWFSVALPCLLLNYYGQGGLILRDPSAAENPFYLLAPRPFLYPLVAIAAAATIVASQALISGSFSLANQSVQLGYMPRLNIVHTSYKQAGQIYMPEINKILAIGCIILVLTFQKSENLTAAYGLAVTGTMAITSILFSVIARQRWGWRLGWVLAFLALFLLIDATFFTSNLAKLLHGGWVPVVLGLGVYTLMSTWKTGRTMLTKTLNAGALPMDVFLEDVARRKPHRVPGTAVFMTSSAEGVPVVLLHHLKHNKVLHEQVILMSVITGEVPEVDADERVRVEKLEHGFWRIIANYGFMETPNIPELLHLAKRHGLRAKQMDTTFYLGRERIIIGGKNAHKAGARRAPPDVTLPRMARWRKRIFVIMSRNARSATEFFGIPPNRVVELGAQVEF